MLRLRWMLAGLAALTLAWAPLAGSLGAQAPGGAPKADANLQTTWYFYKVRWGFQDEFMELYEKNHYPVLKAQQEAGRFAAVRSYVPRYHGDGRADWTFAVELVERTDVTGLPSEAEIIRKLYRDQETFRREERRRFEILDAHWDVPLRPVVFEAR